MNRYDSGYYNDSYYEPEDDEDIDDYVFDWVKFEMREGGYCDPKDPTNFAEACGELGLREELSCWEDATEAEQAQMTQYWLDVAQTLAENAYYESR